MARAEGGSAARHTHEAVQHLLDSLNPPQRAAVTHGDGPLLIFAGAGSGKTRVLTMRVAYLIATQRARPWNVLAVTFTNKAAAEMRARISELVGADPAARGSLRGMWVGTFHSICSLLLRQHGEAIGVPKNFVVFDQGDSHALIKDCLRELNLDEQRYRPAGVSNAISNAKNELVTPREFAQNAQGLYDIAVARVYDRYQQKLLVNKALDFDDLLVRAVDLLRDDADTRARYQERFQHVLVDEYQDVNFAQYRLVEVLARHHRNLCIVGDDDQSIYRFRGADVRLILEFEKDYPNATVIKLEQNYRSTQPILDAAYHIIRRNAKRAEKRLWTQRVDGERLLIHDAADAVEEAWFVAETIQRLAPERSNGWRDFAILCRTNAQSRVFEETFAQLRIPLRLVGAQRFYERREIKDVVAYLRLLANPSDAVSLRRVINVPPRGIGDKTLARLEDEAQRLGVGMIDVVRAPDCEALFDKRAGAALRRFALMFDRLFELAKRATVTELVQQLLADSGYVQALEAERTLEAASRLENLQEFLTTTKQFDEQQVARAALLAEAPLEFSELVGDGGLTDFLQRTALIADLDAWNEKDQAVTMMTVHSAKGLEFPVVCIVGLEEGVFPHARSLNSGDPTDLEEERRLMYVALTRARERVFLSYAHRRTIQGLTTPQLPSRFLDEIPAELRQQRNEVGWRSRQTEWPATPTYGGHRGLDLQRVLSLSSSKPTSQPTSQRPTHPTTFKVGDKVRHAQWGEGIVVKVPKEGEVEVAFPKTTLGIKKLILAYAPLEKM